MTDAGLWIWFQLIFGFASRRGEEALAFYGHPREIWGRSVSQLREDGRLTPGELRQITPESEARAREILETCRSRGYGVITMEDCRYPMRLRHIQQPPAVLYVQGDLGEIDFQE